MQPYEVPEKALESIRDEKDWSPEGWGDGRQRCTLHAICDAISTGYVVVPGVPHPPFENAADMLREANMISSCLGEWNDRSTHAEVVAGFQKAIRLSKAEADARYTVLHTGRLCGRTAALKDAEQRVAA